MRPDNDQEGLNFWVIGQSGLSDGTFGSARLCLDPFFRALKPVTRMRWPLWRHKGGTTYLFKCWHSLMYLITARRNSRSLKKVGNCFCVSSSVISLNTISCLKNKLLAMHWEAFSDLSLIFPEFFSPLSTKIFFWR